MLKLDVRVAFEALILNRLGRIPEGRRQEWLRGLLVQGFRYECQTLRVAQEGIELERVRLPGGVSTGTPGSAFAAWLTQPESRSNTQTRTYPAALDEPIACSKVKPFARLSKVIG